MLTEEGDCALEAVDRLLELRLVENCELAELRLREDTDEKLWNDCDVRLEDVLAVAAEDSEAELTEA